MDEEENIVKVLRNMYEKITKDEFKGIVAFAFLDEGKVETAIIGYNANAKVYLLCSKRLIRELDKSMHDVYTIYSGSGG